MNAENVTKSRPAAIAAQRPARVRTWRRILFVVCLLGLAGGAAWSLWPSPPTLPVIARMPLPGRAGWPLAFTPDGQSLVTMHMQMGVSIWDLKTKTIRASSPGETWAMVAPISPDSRTLVVRCNDRATNGLRLNVIDLKDGSIRATLNLPQPPLLDMKFSEDGSRLLVVTSPLLPNGRGKSQSDTWERRTWNTSDWAEEPVRSMPTPAMAASVSPDDRLAATWDEKLSSVSLWDLSADPPVQSLLESTSPSTQIFGMRFSPDSRTLCVAKTAGATELWDVATRTRRAAFSSIPTNYASRIINFTPDQKLLVTMEVDLMGNRSVFRKLGYLLNWAASGGRYEGPPPYVIVREIATGKIRAVLKDHYRPVISADGKVLATADSDGNLTLWDLSKP